MNRISFNFDTIVKMPIFGYDTETTGLHWYRDKVFGISIAGYDPNTNAMMSEYWDIRDNPRILAIIQDVVNKRKSIIGHNIKFDALMSSPIGIKLPDDRLECTSVRAALINEHEISFGLDALAEKYLNMSKDNEIYQKLADMFGGKPTRDVQIKNLPKAPVALVARYAKTDAELACLLYQWQQHEIENQGLHKIVDLERRLIPVLLDIERAGVRVDLERTESAIADTQKLIDGSEAKLLKFAGKHFNSNSPKQMRELFKVEKGDDGAWRSGGHLLTETESGNPSIDADALRMLASRGHEAASLVLAVRKSSKAMSFLKDHIMGHQLNGRVYPNYNQTRGDNDLGTGTGRFSINDPALQQIPARDKEIASIVRACFIPEDGGEWGSLDYSQFEFRWAAHYIKDHNILEAYKNDPNTDYHQVVADLTGLPRSARFAGDPNAKQINLGLQFGMGDGRLAEELGLPYTMNSRGYPEAGPEAKEVFEKYHGQMPGVKKLLNEASSIAKSRGFVKTIHDRHIRFPGGKFTYKAGGLVFQGSSADCMKLKMIELLPFCKKNDIKMLLSVHDELDFSLPKSTPIEVKRELESIYTSYGPDNEISCRVPIVCQAGYADNWWLASK